MIFGFNFPRVVDIVLVEMYCPKYIRFSHIPISIITIYILCNLGYFTFTLLHFLTSYTFLTTFKFPSSSFSSSSFTPA